MGNTHARLLLSLEQKRDDDQRLIEEIVTTHAAYMDAIERMLGTPPHSFYRIDHVSALKAIRQHDVEISFVGPASAEWFKHVAGVAKAAQGADEHTLQLFVLGELTEIIGIAGQHGATHIATHEPTLEEVFLRFYEPQQEPSVLAG